MGAFFPEHQLLKRILNHTKMPTQNPTVSFVVPCYKLGHLLPECVNSILGQTYGDFEVLIMDDCSPDNTPEVALFFKDVRVRHIRNEQNLGLLRNYNKGISLSRGKYIWLISADDYFRRPYLLQRYTEVLEKNPEVGYTFCSGVGVRDGKETGVLEYSAYEKHDQIVKGHVFLQTLLKSNIVLAPSGLVRRKCYDELGMFPLQKEMAWSGDWYLWCLFALHWDVGYFAEPMVCYREHELSMTNYFSQEKVELMLAGDIAVPWMIKQKADQAGFRKISKKCLQAIAIEYARHLTVKYHRGSASTITMAQFEESLCRNTPREKERNWIRARVYAGIADHRYGHGQPSLARESYWSAVQKDPWMAKVYAKLLLLSLGKLGDLLRRGMRSAS